MTIPLLPSTDDPATAVRHGRAWVDQTAGARIGYSVAEPAGGTDRTVLLIHGAPQTGYAWRKVVPLLVDAGYQVIVPDYRGAGASTKPRDGYDKWTMAADLHHLVQAELGVDGPISVVGHGPIPKFCSANCRYRAWEQERASRAGRAAIVTVDRTVAAYPNDTRAWVAHLDRLAADLERGQFDGDILLAPLSSVYAAIEYRQSPGRRTDPC